VATTAETFVGNPRMLAATRTNNNFRIKEGLEFLFVLSILSFYFVTA
jgi:hypothetical protein